MLLRIVIALCCAVGFSAAVHADDPVKLSTVNMAQLKSAIAKHEGKIVVVDFWATFCIPCRKEFPKLVKIHQQQEAKVACISVTVDDSDNSEKAIRFLKQQKATFENYLLDEKAEAYQKEFGFAAVPCLLVYGRDGKLVKKFSDAEFTYKDVQNVIDRIK